MSDKGRTTCYYAKRYIIAGTVLILLTLIMMVNHVQHSPDRLPDTATTRSERFNHLFVIADDLRPQLGVYRGEDSPNPYSTFSVLTPNLNHLARSSLVLTRAYAQYPVCGPSRTSFLTGRRPDTARVWDLWTYWRTTGGNFTSIPQFFKQHGYTTAGFGKVFHQGKMNNHDDPVSWSEPYYHGEFEHYWGTLAKSWAAVPGNLRSNRPLPDEDVNEKARERLRKFAENPDKPFFLAVGYHKPHMPYNCPSKAYDLYPKNDLELVQNPFFPQNFPEIATQTPEMLSYKDTRQFACKNTTPPLECVLPSDLTLTMRRAYFSCISYVDGLVGDLLAELQALGLAKTTIVTFFGDHGFHLGENGLDGKHTLLEQATRVPLMLRIPGLTDRGVTSDSVVELVDLFPTLVEASGFGPLKKCPDNSSNVALCTEGVSLMPLITNPKKKLKPCAISQTLRFRSMGYSVRTNRYRYTEWPLIQFNETKPELDQTQFWENPHGAELYDHLDDPEENINVVDLPKHRHIVGVLQRMLHNGVDLKQNGQALYEYFRYFS